MSFGFGVGDLLASIKLLSETKRLLDKNPEFAANEGRTIVDELSAALELAMVLTQYAQNTDSQDFESAALPILISLSEATAVFARTVEQFFGHKNSNWHRLLWATRKTKLQREASRVTECVDQARVLLNLFIVQDMGAAKLRSVVPLAIAPPESPSDSTPTSPGQYSRVNSMPWPVTMDFTDDYNRGNLFASSPAHQGDLDIILIPDIGGHSIETWRGYSSSWVSTLISDKSLKTTIVHYSYQSASLLGGDLTHGLQNEGKRLLDHITYKLKSRAALVLCHGVGCCLVRAAIAYGAQAAEYDSDYAESLARLQCVVNFGRPDWKIPGSINTHLNLLRVTAQARAVRRITLLSIWIAAHPLSISEYASDIEFKLYTACEKYLINLTDVHENKHIVANDSLLLISQPSISIPLVTPLCLDGTFFTMCQYQSQQSAEFDRLCSLVSKCLISSSTSEDGKIHDINVLNQGLESLAGKKSIESRKVSLLDSSKDDKRTAHQLKSPKLQVTSNMEKINYIRDLNILEFQSALADRLRVFKQSLMPLVVPTTRHPIDDTTTCEWIHTTEAYRQWYSHSKDKKTSSEDSKTGPSYIALLCIIGEEMTGKSTLLKFIFESFGIVGSSETQQITRLVHICDENIPESTKGINIVKSLIWQLLEVHPLAYLSVHHQHSMAPASFGELGLLLVRLISGCSSSILIAIDNLELIGGIDRIEDEKSGTLELFPFLEELASLENVKIVTTCDTTRIKLCYQVDLSTFVEEQSKAIYRFTRSKLKLYAVTSMHQRLTHERVGQSLCASSRGSFLKVSIGIHLLSNVRNVKDFELELENYERGDVPSLLSYIGGLSIRKLTVLYFCEGPMSFREVNIISEFLSPVEAADESSDKKFTDKGSSTKEQRFFTQQTLFEQHLALRDVNDKAEFLPFNGIFIDIRDGFIYPSIRRIKQTMIRLDVANETLQAMSEPLKGLCVEVLEMYSASTSSQTVNHAVNLYQHSDVAAEHSYRELHPLLAYALRDWQRLVPLMSEHMKSQTIFSGQVNKVMSQSRSTYDKKPIKSLLSRGSLLQLNTALRDAGVRKDYLAIRNLLDAHYEILDECDFDDLFSVWVQEAANSDDLETVCFPLNILDLSRGKVPSQLDICFQHERKLHHLFSLAIRNKFWGVAGGIWIALTESETLDLSEWMEEYGYDMLYEAVQSGNCSIVTELINEGAGEDCPSSNDATLLQMAAAIGAEDIIDVLLATGKAIEDEFSQVDPSVTERTNITELDSDLADPQVKRQTALMIASASGFIDIVSLLLSASLELDEPYYVNYEDLKGRSALHYAVLFGHEDIVNDLLSYTANVEWKDSDGRTPMHMAAAGNWEGLTELLCKQGASSSTKDKQGLTPLHVAACNGSSRTAAKLILRSPPSVHLRDKKGYTPLHHAADFGSEATVQLLLENGAPCHAPAKDGNTPLHLAARSEHPSDAILQLLLEKSKNPHVENKQGFTPSQLAEKHCNMLLLERLRASEQRESQARDATSHKQQPSQTPFSIFGQQVDDLGKSVVARNLREANPDHYLSRAVEDLRKVTESIREEHGRLGPQANWNSNNTSLTGKAARDSKSSLLSSNS